MVEKKEGGRKGEWKKGRVKKEEYGRLKEGRKEREGRKDGDMKGSWEGRGAEGERKESEGVSVGVNKQET